MRGEEKDAVEDDDGGMATDDNEEDFTDDHHVEDTEDQDVFRIHQSSKLDDAFLVDFQEFGLSEIPDGDDCDGAFDESINSTD
jgi:hypothetical protein